MAEPGSPTNTTHTPTSSDLGSSASAPPHDWEVLSMSMSSSAFGTPGSASVVCGCDACTGRASGNGVPHSVSLPVSLESGTCESPLPGLVNQTGSDVQASEVEYLPTEGQSDLKRGRPDQPDSGIILTGGAVSGSGLPSGNWAESPLVGGSSDVGLDDGEIAVVSTSSIEPFTEGWKPHLGVAAGMAPDRASFGDFRDYVDSENIFLPEDYHEVTFSVNEDTQPLVLQKEMRTSGEEVVTEGIAGERSLSGLTNVDADKVPKKRARKVQPSGAWWKHQASLWRAQSRKSNAVWSIALAATVLGIVIIGHRWQRERHQNQQLRLELCAKDEKLNDLMYQVNRLKEVITGRRRVPVMRSSSFSRFSEY